MSNNSNEKKGIFDSLKTRYFKAGSYSVLSAVIVIAIAVVINILIDSVPEKYTKIDLTKNSLFSISDDTKQTAAALTDDVTIYWVVSSGNEDSVIESLVTNFTELSSHIKLEKKDPVVSPTFITQYEEEYSDNSLIVVNGDRFKYIDYYDMYETAFDYYTYQSYISGFNGETALTSAIDYVTKDELPKMYTLSGHGELTFTEKFAAAVDKQNIVTEELSLLTLGSVPEDAGLVMIASPMTDISVSEKDMLIAYLERGGKLFVMSDLLSDGSTLPNLEALLDYYGVSLMYGYALEQNQDYYAYGEPYYLLPELSDHSITGVIKNNGYFVLLAIAQPMQISENVRDSVNIQPLLTTSNTAYLKAPYSTTLLKQEGDFEGEMILSAAITEANADGSTAKLLWIGSSTIVDDTANQMVSGGNEDFFLNALTWLSEENGISTIHTKNLDVEFLTISEQTAALLKFVMIGAIPLLYLVIGIVIVVRRKRQ